MPRAPRPIGGAGTPARLARSVQGIGLTALRYLVNRVPLYRRNRVDPGADVPDLDRELPGDPAGVQRARDGVGALFHRSYRIYLTDEELGPEALIDLIAEEPNRVTATEMARFETFDGRPARDLRVGDELLVRLPGPWDGPVRVIERTPRSFRLVTLQGHMEAGEIEFSTDIDERGFLRFQIESWARSGDRLFHWIYERLPFGREMQLHMWAQFCERAAAASGGVRMSNVSCTTRRLG